MTDSIRFSQDPRNLTAAEIWAEIEADPVAVARIRQGGEDIAAGRWYTFDTKTGKSTPNPDWPKDGPQPRRIPMYESEHDTPEGPVKVPHTTAYPDPADPDNVTNDEVPEPVAEPDPTEPEPKTQEDPR